MLNAARYTPGGEKIEQNHVTKETYIPEREYSDQTARLVDEEVKRIIDEAFTLAEKIIDDHWDACTAVAEALLKYETLQGDEVTRLVRGERLDKPTIAELLEKEAGMPPQASSPPKPAASGHKPGDEPTGDVMPSPA